MGAQSFEISSGEAFFFTFLQGISKLGLSADWAVNIIGQVGNYEEVFEKNLGMSTPLKIARGMNQLYRDGGLFYIPPIK